MKTEIKVLGQIVRITPSYENYYAFERRIIENTIEINIGGDNWKICAIRCVNLSICEIRMRSGMMRFSLQIHQDGFEFVDGQIISGFRGMPPIQKKFKTYVENLKE